MKRNISFILLSIMFLMVACDEEDLLLINIVNPNGSILRKIIMTWDKPDFDLTDSKVPVDSSWSVKQDFSISENSDTVYTLEALKQFTSVEEINEDYKSYEGPNGDMNRWVEFSRSFRWFTTIYRYSENIEKAIEGYYPEEFLDADNLHLFYMPEKIKLDYLSGADSTAYQAKFDTLEELTEEWMGRSLIKSVFLEVEAILSSFPESKVEMDKLWDNEALLGDLIFETDLDEAVDSVFGAGFMATNKALLDSAVVNMEEYFGVSFDAKSYLIQTQMPGELLLTNGYVDTDGNIVWEVNGEVMLCKDYSMWAESVRTNWWAWIVTGFFLLFVIVGLIRRKRA